MTYLFLKWVHIIAMAYWLGGEWGVFNASRPITNKNLSLEERKRHMETAYRIDILPRTGIILLLPLGLHMGALANYQPLHGPWIVGMWIFVAFWLSITYSAYFKRGTDAGVKLTKIDESFRYIVIPLLIGFAIYSLVKNYPFPQGWYAAKVGLYGVALVIGLLLRFIMRRWVMLFRRITAGDDPEAEAMLDKELAYGRGLAYIYWVVIGSVALFGVFKGALLI
ncbi:MAG: hypothetical protein OER91_03515 [Gammaproteobacteria bacterium]|nr:hypothetical protein [Gammaproteobacteria bacterium]